MRRIWLIRRIWATIAARIFRVSRILRANGALARSWGLRDDGRTGIAVAAAHAGTPIP